MEDMRLRFYSQMIQGSWSYRQLQKAQSQNPSVSVSGIERYPLPPYRRIVSKTKQKGIFLTPKNIVRDWGFWSPPWWARPGRDKEDIVNSIECVRVSQWEGNGQKRSVNIKHYLAIDWVKWQCGGSAGRTHGGSSGLMEFWARPASRRLLGVWGRWLGLDPPSHLTSTNLGSSQQCVEKIGNTGSQLHTRMGCQSLWTIPFSYDRC